jgi:hypothetical protein
MIYIERLEFIHKSGDVLYPVKITRKSSGKQPSTLCHSVWIRLWILLR